MTDDGLAITVDLLEDFGSRLASRWTCRWSRVTRDGPEGADPDEVPISGGREEVADLRPLSLSWTGRGLP
jgi:hypothetical protein